jgi:ribose 5-phosphate isomerase B
MRIAVGSDHRGFEAKRKVVPLLKRLGHEVKDYGCDSTAPCDYPDFAAPVARAVAKGEYELGILFDGGGMGMSMVANKIRGVRAAVVLDEVNARRAREHHHCNIMCIGSDLMTEDHIRTVVEIFLSTPLGDGRHLRRIHKINQIEEQEWGGHATAPSTPIRSAQSPAAHGGGTRSPASTHRHPARG